MDRTSLDWAHLRKMGCDKTSRCYDAIFDSVALVTSAVHSYKICIQGKLMIQSAE